MSDLSSLSKSAESIVTHLDWKISVDFAESCLHSEATYNVHVLQPNATTLNLDTAHLDILEVRTDEGAPLDFILHPLVESKPHLGRRLEINLPQRDKDNNCKITIAYSTTKACSALQWLPPSQTAGKEHPYLFTQCQAIHARSLVPCQDACGVKMTYTATATVPAWATCVMSALLKKTETSNDKKIFTWDQPVPISSYLLALAVGDLVKRDLSKRCAIWSEPSVIESAAFEFSETEEFLATAEHITGYDYVWGRYDLLCLPPSFPYGGMENPCLTFVTPTLLAGDKSLADVVAHEIAHRYDCQKNSSGHRFLLPIITQINSIFFHSLQCSWTGNLVTNATWYVIVLCSCHFVIFRKFS